MHYKYGTYGYIAKSDLEVARDLVKSHPSVSVQYSQQACENILKQCLLEQRDSEDQADIMKSYKLQRLSESLGILEEYSGSLAELSEYYFDGRHPGINYVEPSEKVAKKMLDLTEIVVGKVEEYITEMRLKQKDEKDEKVTIEISNKYQSEVIKLLEKLNSKYNTLLGDTKEF